MIAVTRWYAFPRAWLKKGGKPSEATKTCNSKKRKLHRNQTLIKWGTFTLPRIKYSCVMPWKAEIRMLPGIETSSKRQGLGRHFLVVYVWSLRQLPGYKEAPGNEHCHQQEVLLGDVVIFRKAWKLLKRLCCAGSKPSIIVALSPDKIKQYHFTPV